MGLLRRFHHPAGFDASGAGRDVLDAAIGNGAHTLNIGFKAPFGHFMGMADVIAHHWFFSTNITNS